jgi:choline kinase
METTQGSVKDYCEVKTNFPEADFWLTRRGSITTVGKPSKAFNAESIGIKVTRTDLLLPDFLYYLMEYRFMGGYWKERATGTTNLVNIRTKDVLAVPLTS